MAIESDGAVNPVFRAMFRVEMLDCGCQQGLAVGVADSAGNLAARHAIRIRYDTDLATVAQRLRALADWVDLKSREVA